jgi:prevent-host-death family protein
MSSVTAMEAKNRFGQLLERVLRGEEVVITKHEKPVARLIPEGRANLASVREAAAGLLELQKRIAKRTGNKSKLTFDEVKSAVAEGRR